MKKTNDTLAMISVRNMCIAREYDKALEFIENNIPEQNYTEEVFLYKVLCMLLSESNKHSFRKMESLLKKANRLYPKSHAILFELGKFYHVIMDDAVKAFPYFLASREKLSALLSETDEAIIDCLNEVNERKCQK